MIYYISHQQNMHAHKRDFTVTYEYTKCSMILINIHNVFSMCPCLSQFFASKEMELGEDKAINLSNLPGPPHHRKNQLCHRLRGYQIIKIKCYQGGLNTF